MNRILQVSLLTCVLAACESASQAIAQTPTTETAVLLWASFECSAFARMADNPKEQERLFKLGYENGKRFIEAMKARKFSEDELRKIVPIGVLYRLAGPSTDFILGVIYATAESEANDRVVKKDSSGLMLPVTDWTTDPELTKSKAETQLRNRNCALLK